MRFPLRRGRGRGRGRRRLLGLRRRRGLEQPPSCPSFLADDRDAPVRRGGLGDVAGRPADLDSVRVGEVSVVVDGDDRAGDLSQLRQVQRTQGHDGCLYGHLNL